MQTITPATEVRPSTGRMYLWLGIAAPFIGIAIYFVQFYLRILKLPWYLPLFGTAGVAFMMLALVHGRTAWRYASLALVALLASVQWFFVAGGLGLPAYKGPVAAGNSFPAFNARFYDGSPFTS